MPPRKPYVDRTYRNVPDSEGLVTFTVVEKESDLWIATDRDRTRTARAALLGIRRILEEYISQHPTFRTTLEPLPDDKHATEEVRRMLNAGAASGVGPMAAVAGTVSDYVGRALLETGATEVLVENGGDLFVASNRERVVAVFAGESPLSMKVGVKIKPERTPLGVSTSSGTVGPSLSLGKADAAVVTAEDSSLADASATAIANHVKSPDHVNAALAFAQGIEGIAGVLIIAGDRLGAWGDMELAEL